MDIHEYQAKGALVGLRGAGEIEELVRSAPEKILQVVGRRALLARVFDESRLFRLVLHEAEKTLAVVDLDIARLRATG